MSLRLRLRVCETERNFFGVSYIGQVESQRRQSKVLSSLREHTGNIINVMISITLGSFLSPGFELNIERWV